MVIVETANGMKRGSIYLRPKPKTTTLGSLGIRLPGFGMKRSGINFSGSGYSMGSLNIALIAFEFSSKLVEQRNTYQIFAMTMDFAGSK